MTFFLNLLFSIVYSFVIGQAYDKKQISSVAFFVLILPLIVIWLLICGGQNGVGTDYEAYLGLFKGELIEQYSDKGEYLFFYIVTWANSIGLKGQILFYIFYGLGFYFFFLIVKRLEISYLFIFILLYLTVSNLFNNQLNGLRQAIATYIGTYAIIQLNENKKWGYFFWCGVAFFLHISSSVFFLVYLFRWIEKVNFKLLYIILLGSFFIGFFLNLEKIFGILPIDQLPMSYAAYIESGKVKETQLLVRLTKYIFIPLYWFSISLIKTNKLNKEEAFLYYFGFFAFCFRLLLINIGYISRITESFLLLSLFPLFYYIRELYIQRKLIFFVVLVTGLIIFYFLKTVIFPTGEYLYNSIYF